MSTNWITLSQTAGTGNQVVTVSAVTNEVMSERNLRIKITTGARTEYVFVTQDAAPLMVTRIEFTGCQFPPISYTGGTLTTSDGRYNITAYYNDGSVVPQVAATVTGNSFSSSAINASLSVVSAGTMNLTASFSGKSASTTYTVMQMGVPEGRYIEYSGNSQVNVSGNWSNTGTTNVIANNYSGGYGIIVFDNTVDYLPYQAFINKTGLTEVNIPSTVIAMSTEIFYGCTNLVAVNGLENLSSLYVAGQDGKQFAGCSSLSSITLPEVMTGQSGALSPYMFSGCSSLTTIGYNGTMDEFGNLTKASNWKNGSVVRYIQCTDGIIDLERYRQITYLAASKLPNVTGEYEHGVHYQKFTPTLSTSNHTFNNGVGLLSFDDDVTGIGSSAFYYSTGMTEVFIPDSVKTIGYDAFANCRDLLHFEMPNSVETLVQFAFMYCTSLSSITLSNSLTQIKFSTFLNCTNLSSIIIPSGITTIGDNDNWPLGVFANCQSLSSVTLPSTITDLCGSLFSGCSSLETIIYQGTKSQWYTINKHSEWRNYSSIRYVQCIDGTVDLDENVIYVTYNSDYSGKTLRESVVESAFTTTPYFNDNTNPRKISFEPNQSITLKEGCFNFDSYFNTISLPVTVQNISGNTFGISVFNRALTSRYINYQGTKAQWNNINITDSLAVTDKIICTDGDIYVREPIAFTYKATAKLPEIYDTGTTTTGIHINRPWPNGSWSEYEHTYNGGNNTGVLSYVGNFNQVGYMFIKCNAMYEIEMPSQVTDIGAGTFSGCTFLEDVVLPDTITNIRTWAFKGCIMLGELTYKGTKAQWNNITLGQLWNDESSISVIHCTDGDISV